MSVPKLEPVNSSMIKGIGYKKGKDKVGNVRSKTGDVYVQFTNGTIWVYEEVSVEAFDALMKAESIGQYFLQNFKNKYAGAKVA